MSAPVVNYPHTMFAVAPLAGGATIWLPNPETTAGNGLIATMVNSGRNASAVVVAQKVGRDQDKTEFKWNYMNKDEWETLLQFFDVNFAFNFTYYSPVAAGKITRKCYISDRKFNFYDIDANGDPTAYVDLSFSIVDTGEGS